MTEHVILPSGSGRQEVTPGCVHVTIRLLLSAKKRREALGILRAMTEQTKVEPGCVDCRVTLDFQDERAVTLDEIWASEGDLKRHLRSDRFRTVLLVVEMASHPPEVRFDVIAHSTGIETIENARA